MHKWKGVSPFAVVLEWGKDGIRVKWERNITRWQEHFYPSTAALSFSKEGLAVYLENSHLTKLGSVFSLCFPIQSQK